MWIQDGGRHSGLIVLLGPLLGLLPGSCWPVTVLLALVWLIAVGWLAARGRLGGKQPRDPLMEIAGALHGSPPAALVDRAQRIAAKRAVAAPPASQEEQLAALDTTPAPRFAIDDPAWLEHLDREGFAVVASVASPEDLAVGEALLWDFLEEHTAWRRACPATWTDEAYEKVGSVQNGLLREAGVGQSAFVWHIRRLPLVRRAFEMMWDTRELLVSFDGANVFRPWHHGFRKTVCGWWHVDQGAGKKGRHAVQGLVSLFPADATTGGLTVVPRSHHRFEEIVEDQADPSVDYVTVQAYEPVMQELPKRLVCCDAGDLILWDSRCVHANAPAPQLPVGPPDKLLRAVAYVCMTPKAFAPQEVLRGRQAAFEFGFTTSHWPQRLDLGSGREGPSTPLAEAPEDVRKLVC